MNKEYKIKLDLNKKLYNKKMAFNQFDENVNDFYIEVTKNNEVIKDLDKSIVTLVVIKPNNAVDAQFIETKEGQIYADLKPSMCDLVGNYQAKAMIVLEEEIVTTDIINYSVNEDKIISRLNEDVVSDERFALFTDALARLSTIEISEEQRVINEAERILSEENRKIEEAKRVEAELIRQHEEADRAKYDATRESNENIRKQNESIRLANETNRIDEEAKRVDEENKRKLAEEERKANYDFMTEDEERRRLEANAHKEAEVLRVQAETNRVNEEAKRRTTEQARVSAENTRVNNENTRKANETTRQTNETHRVEAETQRQNRYNSFIADAEINANNFENYTNSAKIKEEERKSNELDRKSQEDRRVSNEVERISNENTRKANEKAREKNETSRQNIFENKVDEVDTKISELNTTKDNFVSNINTKVDSKISELDNVKDNFVSSVNTKVDNKISELDNAKSDMTNTVSNKVNEVENRFNALTSKQQQDAEVIDARDGETSLKARLDRDIEKAKQVYVDVEGSHISSDSSVGYAKDVEILGNTVQSASNLADIRSVGDKVEGQELYEIPVLSCGKNLIDYAKFNAHTVGGGTVQILKDANSIKINGNGSYASAKIKLNLKKGEYIVSKDCAVTLGGTTTGRCFIFINEAHAYTLSNTKQSQEISLTSDSEVMIDLIGTWGESATFDATFNVQLEEGTIATPYEPYVEDKLTILSPVQLEKVGDVRDRIIEKDGVWGVEKHIKTDLLKGGGNEDFRLNKVLDKGGYQFTWFANMGAIANKNSEVISSTMNSYVGSNEEYSSNMWIYNGITYVIHHPTISTKDEIKLWLQANPTIVKFASNTPQFIPLPHDQQVKLRTFANKTNISLLTEIEGTIKAQVPKSLGATVNTHTEQISNLNKELDRVKKLEESTVSTVETESDFTTVEATSNGYFEDVKLEGKTLVNLLTRKINCVLTSTNRVQASSLIKNLSFDKEYTLFINGVTTSKYGAYISIKYADDAEQVLINANINNNVCVKFKLSESKEVLKLNIAGWSSNSTDSNWNINYAILLEGDHTQNPPSYFEGLKSVGEDTDEIVVSSVKGDGNLVIDANINLYIPQNNAKVEKTTEGIRAYNRITGDDRVFLQPFRVRQGSKVTISFDVKVDTEGSSTLFYLSFLDANFNRIITTNFPTKTYTTSFERITKTFDVGNASYIRIELVSFGASAGATYKNIMVSNHSKPYVPYQSDKKRLLYYNNETQAWEKPILREWDSIEKHADGKYYYHQRSEEVVLNGSENWIIDNNNTRFGLYNIESMTGNVNVNVEQISDKFCVYDRYGEKIGSFGVGTGFIRIQNNFGFTTANEFKQWLQANNVTVVYQLAQEKVYECTNIDLITYANETNFIVESGAIVPKTTLKVHNNISNVVSLLQKKVSLLESNVKASQEVQDMMILETDMRMLDIELALMEFIPMKLNLGGSNMLRSATYFNFLKNHIINETYEKEYLENVMNKYLATGRINQDEYNELYKMLYPPVYDIELPIEY